MRGLFTEEDKLTLQKMMSNISTEDRLTIKEILNTIEKEKLDLSGMSIKKKINIPEDVSIFNIEVDLEIFDFTHFYNYLSYYNYSGEIIFVNIETDLIRREVSEYCRFKEEALSKEGFKVLCECIREIWCNS